MTYQAMAAVYDRLMLHVNYEKWVDGLEFQWKRLGKNPRTVLDAGCGTGSVLLPLAGRGYQVYGIDNSGDMLAVCRDKLLSRSLSAVLLEMDIRKVRLPEQVDTAICLCDTLNYLVKENDLLKCFKSIFSVLKPGGSFVFDMRTPYYYEQILGDNQWVEQEDDVVLIWENDFSQKPIINIELTFFVKQERNKDIFRKYAEEHQQKCYQVEVIKELAQKTGFDIKYTGSDLFGRSLDLIRDERMYFVACKV
ncbi:MAG: class I SAM-dependent DNA methyltransferase [Bacillota bacterium]|jgi:SAM-dependent methyltransferase|nr:class I SAM-dependent methyltransferase [Clostridia bacterium]